MIVLCRTLIDATCRTLRARMHVSLTPQRYLEQRRGNLCDIVFRLGACHQCHPQDSLGGLAQWKKLPQIYEIPSGSHLCRTTLVNLQMACTSDYEHGWTSGYSCSVGQKYCPSAPLLHVWTDRYVLHVRLQPAISAM